LDPQQDLARGQTCTVTVRATAISDVDTNDPPDNLDADFRFSFTTAGTPARIHEIQDRSHISPFDNQIVSGVPGVVTATRSNGFYFQDPDPDDDDRTSEGLFVFTGSSAARPAVGTAVRVSGRVTEFRGGCSPDCASTNRAFANLTTTEIVSPSVVPTGTGTIPATVVGPGGRTPPTEVIEDDADGDVERQRDFDPEPDGIDFYESLEGMFTRVNDPVVVGPSNNFGEIPVLAERGAGASVRTLRGGIAIRPIDLSRPVDYQLGDFNPERIILDDAIRPTPRDANVRDRLTPSVEAVVDYSFGNFKFLVTNEVSRTDGGLQREVTDTPKRNELTTGSYNVENLDGMDPQDRFDRIGRQIVTNVKAPDVLSLEEIQDNDGAAITPSSDASVTYARLIEAIQRAGGPTYEYRQIDPVPASQGGEPSGGGGNQNENPDGGEPGGNIRVAFLFRRDRGVSFVDRPGGTAVTENRAVRGRDGAQLLFSPGRIEPNDPAFQNSRKPLAGEFRFRGRTFFVIANHFNSKGGDDPLFGRFQPPNRRSEAQRHQQARIENQFVRDILDIDRNARVIVAGDLNDFDFSETLSILREGDGASSGPGRGRGPRGGFQGPRALQPVGAAPPSRPLLVHLRGQLADPRSHPREPEPSQPAATLRRRARQLGVRRPGLRSRSPGLATAHHGQA
ncbi:MAG: endonuclease/exonuclease/phosphatase family protein, partial [Thermoleophilaceae bacterium]